MLFVETQPSIYQLLKPVRFSNTAGILSPQPDYNNAIN
jgi:hypothetical protein